MRLFLKLLFAYLIVCFIFIAVQLPSMAEDKKSLATVAGQTITDEELQTSRQLSLLLSGETTVVDGPAYTKCVSSLLEANKAAVRENKETPSLSKEDALTQCKTMDKQLDEIGLSRLITSIWLENESKEDISDKKVEEAYNLYIKENFENAQEFENKVAEYGITTDDVKDALRINLQQEALFASVEYDRKITDKQLREIYDGASSEMRKEQTFSEATEDIKLYLSNSRQEEAQQKFVTELIERWRKQTTCDSTIRISDLCSNVEAEVDTEVSVDGVQ